MKVYIEKEHEDALGLLSEVLKAIKWSYPTVKVHLIRSSDYDWEVVLAANLEGLVQKKDKSE